MIHAEVSALSSVSTISFRIKGRLNYPESVVFHSSQIQSPAEHVEGRMGSFEYCGMLRLMEDLNAHEIEDMVIRICEKEL